MAERITLTIIIVLVVAGISWGKIDWKTTTDESWLRLGRIDPLYRIIAGKQVNLGRVVKFAAWIAGIGFLLALWSDIGI